MPPNSAIESLAEPQYLQEYAISKCHLNASQRVVLLTLSILLALDLTIYLLCKQLAQVLCLQCF